MDFERIITQGKSLVGAIIEMHKDAIEAAYLKQGEGTFNIGLGLKITPTQEGTDTKVEATINFVESKVKDSIEFVVSDQQSLPGLE